MFDLAVWEWTSHKKPIHKRTTKILESGLKSELFARCSVTFSHQYHTLNMARKGKKSVISHFYSACSWKHINPLIYFQRFGEPKQTNYNFHCISILSENTKILLISNSTTLLLSSKERSFHFVITSLKTL